LPNTNTYVL